MHGRRVHRFAEPLVRFRYHAGSKTARDAMRAQDEAMQIRLLWARNAPRPGDHARLRLASSALLLPRISGWPEPYDALRSRGSE